jgi:3-dehydroquinate dehydratase-2
MTIHVYHGPNLNKLQDRSSEQYGTVDLADINDQLQELADELGLQLEIRQTNSEGTLVDWIQEADKDGLALNAGGYTHTSVAIRDAIDLVEYPVIEVHLSNIHAREPFRRESRISAVCEGQVSGLGVDSYRLAIRALARRVSGD